MVLVDASVWIRALAGRPPYREDLDELLAAEQVTGHEFVYGELLIGGSGDRRPVLDAYRLIPQASAVPHSEVVEFIRHRKLGGRGVGWIDIHLLASALVNHLQFWTADQRLASLAQELGIAYPGPNA
jgi:hypothetical protein